MVLVQDDLLDILSLPSPVQDDLADRQCLPILSLPSLVQDDLADIQCLPSLVQDDLLEEQCLPSIDGHDLVDIQCLPKDDLVDVQCLPSLVQDHDLAEIQCLPSHIHHHDLLHIQCLPSLDILDLQETYAEIRRKEQDNTNWFSPESPCIFLGGGFVVGGWGFYEGGWFFLGDVGISGLRNLCLAQAALPSALAMSFFSCEMPEPAWPCDKLHHARAQRARANSNFNFLQCLSRGP